MNGVFYSILEPLFLIGGFNKAPYYKNLIHNCNFVIFQFHVRLDITDPYNLENFPFLAVRLPLYNLLNYLIL